MFFLALGVERLYGSLLAKYILDSKPFENGTMELSHAFS